MKNSKIVLQIFGKSFETSVRIKLQHVQISLKKSNSSIRYGHFWSVRILMRAIVYIDRFLQTQWNILINKCMIFNHTFKF